MRGRKAWTGHEDEVLRLLVEERRENKWSVIARIMQQQFGIEGKTGKKCRERYHNNLKATINNSEWTPEQDQALLQLHHQYGNKWASIAHLISGRSENCVKNRFYSKLRKICRKLNHFNTEKQSSSLPAIRIELISRIVSVSEGRFKTGCKIGEQWLQFCTKLINTLYTLEEGRKKTNCPHQHASYQSVIQDLAFFEQHFKKKRIIRNNQGEEDYKQRLTPSSNSHLDRQRRSIAQSAPQFKEPQHFQIKFEGSLGQISRICGGWESQEGIQAQAIFEELKVNQGTLQSFDELENEFLKMNSPHAMFEESEQYPYYYGGTQDL